MIVPLDHPKIIRIEQQPTTRYNNTENFIFWVYSTDYHWLESIELDNAERVHAQTFIGLIQVKVNAPPYSQTEFYSVFETSNDSLISILKLMLDNNQI